MEKNLTDQVYMVFDYETYSECELKKAGAFEYSMHPSTEILCITYRIGTRKTLAKEKTKLIRPFNDAISGQDFQHALNDPNIKLVAHNAFFEQCITKNVVKIDTELSRWHCTAALARSMGLPGKLEHVGEALCLSNQKDKEGHRVMLKLSQPRKATKNKPATRYTPENAPDDFKKLYEYGIKDTDAEVELFLKLPPMHYKERAFWKLNQKTNWHGFAVDRKLVTNTLKLLNFETRRLDNTMLEVSGGALKSARQRDATLALLDSHDTVLPDLRAGTVKETLAQKDLDPIARDILEIREQVSKSSTAKYKAFEIRTRYDGRARDNTVFFGAHTGREAGTGLQPQNLFKAVMSQKDVETGIELIKAGDRDTIEALYPKPMELYASALRSCIVAAPNHVLHVGDFATIEVRVLFWLAGHKKGLEAFEKGEDLYCGMAGDIYGEDPSTILSAYKNGNREGLWKRQLGKQTVLGAGFGIGVDGVKFQATCKAYDIEISKSLAQRAIQAYRQKHKPIPQFWNTIESAAKRAMQNPGKRFRHGFLIWQLEGDYLTVQLPIGRKLHYFKPRLERVQTLYGERLTLTYRSIESKSKKFLRTSTWGGKLTENVVQAVARDLLKEAILRLHTHGYETVLEVHDEIVCEMPASPHAIDEDHRFFLTLMGKNPDWAKDLPIKVEGWCADRYRK